MTAAAAASAAAAATAASTAATAAAATSTTSQRAVDLTALWTRLLRPRRRGRSASRLRPPLDEVRVLEVSQLAPIGGNACSIDGTLLQRARSLAARIAQIHCGIAQPFLPLRAECPRSATAVAQELANWAQRAIPRQGATCASESPLAQRLSLRCGDLLCSDTACFEHSVQRCIARLTPPTGAAAPAAVGAPSTQVLRERCELWLHRLPLHLSPRCDALTGRCLAPPDAYPGLVRWPSIACLELGWRALCAAQPQGVGAARGKPAGTASTQHLCGPCAGFLP